MIIHPSSLFSIGSARKVTQDTQKTNTHIDPERINFSPGNFHFIKTVLVLKNNESYVKTSAKITKWTKCRTEDRYVLLQIVPDNYGRQ